MTDPSSHEADEILLLRMMEQDQDALVEMLEVHGPAVNGYLIKHYSKSLSHIEIEVAINEAAFRVWKHASKYDLNRGPLFAWFLTIANNEALRLVGKGEKYVPFDESAHGFQIDDCHEEEPEADRKTKRQIKLFDYIVEKKLVGLQQNIIREDLHAGGGTADNGRLAAKYGKTTNNIHVSRHKARDNIKRLMKELERNPPSPGEMS